MTDSTSRTPDKLLSVSRNDSGRAELEGIRARRRQGNQSENNQAIGGRVSQDEGVGGDDSSSSDSDAERRRRRRIRRRLKHKHNEDPIPLRLPWTKWMNSEAKNHTVAVIGEFVGTAMFLFFAFAGTGVANIPQGNSATGTTTGAATGFNLTTLLYISISFGFSLMVNAWIFFRISGGLFNPAVTLALALLGALTPVRAVLLFIAQLSGACFASILVKSIFPTAFNVQTTLAAGTSLARGVFIEAFCTAELVFTIIMLAKEKHRATFIAPIGIGLALFIGELVGVYYTGGSLNPARSFGPAAVSHNFESTHWIYWIGPSVGTIMAVAFYKLIKILEYEMANPGQDGDVENDPTQNPDHEIAQVVEERAVEVEEIQAIEEQGGFDALTDGTPGPSGAATPAAGGGTVESSTNESLQNQRASRFSEDLEAQWAGGEKAGSVGKSGKGTNAS